MDAQSPHASVPVMVNPTAGALRGRHNKLPLTYPARVQAWLDRLHEAGQHPLVQVAPDEAAVRIEALLDAGHRRIAVGGGDGTLARVAPLVVEHEAELVCLPLGTQNHFAKDLGIDLDPETWDALLLSPEVAEVDVGLVNGLTFLNNVSVGLYPRMVRERRRMEGERLLGSKRLASLWATMKLMRRRTRTLRVRWEGRLETGAETGEFRTKAMLIANNDYADAVLAPLSRQSLSNRTLMLVWSRSLRGRDMARMAHYALAANINECPDLEVIRARSLILTLDRRTVAVAVDGELTRTTSPIHVSHHPRRLKAVLHPP